MALTITALDAIRVFGPLLSPHAPGIDTLLKQLTTELVNKEPVDAWVLDWLRTVHGLTSEGYCYQASSDIPPPWYRFMTELVHLPQPPAPVTRVRHGLHVDKLREDFDHLFTHRGSYGFAGERTAWKHIESAYQKFVEGIENGKPAEPPTLTAGDIENAKQDGEIEVGSQRARHFDRIVDDLAQAAKRLYEATTVAHRVENTPGDPPAGPLGALLAAAHDVVVEGRTEDDARQALAALVDRVDDDGRLELARVTEPLYESGPWEHVLLLPIWQRRKDIMRQARELERQGADVELITVALAVDDLDAATGYIQELRAENQTRARERKVRGSLDRAAALIERLDAKEDYLARIATLREQGQETKVEDAREIENQVSTSLREQQIAEAKTLLKRLRALGVTELTELSEREFSQWKSRSVHISDAEFDSLRGRVEEAIEARRRSIRTRLDQAGIDLEVLREDAASNIVDALRDRLTTVEVELAEGDLERARLLTDELTHELQRQRVIRWNPEEGESTLIDHVVAFTCQRASFDPSDVVRLHVALKAKRFAVLAGLTGTGKSTLAREYAAALGARHDSGRFWRIAVRPNWIDGSEVLGYVNPLTSRFEPGWLATVIRDCQRDPDLPSFVLLDEMNLAPVEHYLSDALAAMEEVLGDEERPTVTLYPLGITVENEDQWPSELPYPANLFIIGTVNIDESTRPLTDRVLDRTSLIQLRTTIDERHHDRRARDRSRQSVALRMSDLASIRVEEPDGRFHDQLIALGDVLGRMGIGLGARNHIEIERLVANSVGVMSPEDAIDSALLQRVLPRIRGYRRDLGDHLGDLRDQIDDLRAARASRVLRYWIENLGDHDYVDGTNHLVGLIAHQ